MRIVGNQSAIQYSEPIFPEPDLFEQSAFLDDIGDGPLFRALRLVDVLQSEQFL